MRIVRILPALYEKSACAPNLITICLGATNCQARKATNANPFFGIAYGLCLQIIQLYTLKIYTFWEPSHVTEIIPIVVWRTPFTLIKYRISRGYKTTLKHFTFKKNQKRTANWWHVQRDSAKGAESRVVARWRMRGCWWRQG